MKTFTQYLAAFLRSTLSDGIYSLCARRRKSRLHPKYLESFEPRLLMSTGSMANFTFTESTVTWDGATSSAYSGIYTVMTTDNQDFQTLASGWSLPVSNVTDLGGDGFYAFATTASSSTVASWLSGHSADLQALAPDFIGAAVDDLTPSPDNVYLDVMNVPSAWKVTTGSQLGGGIVVATLNSGFDINNDAFAGNIWTNWGEDPTNTSDDDHNGYTNDIHGYNFYNTDADTNNPDNGHGTSIAGYLGANGSVDDNFGVAPNVQILPVKISDTDSAFGNLQFIEGLNYLITLKQQGVNIVAADCSFGGLQWDPTAYYAIQRAGENGIFLVCSAGNDATDDPRTGIVTGTFFPAGYDSTGVVQVAGGSSFSGLDNVITVGSTLYDNNYGGESLWYSSPGNGSNFNGTYQWVSVAAPSPADGPATSFTAPMVSGILALEASANPNATMDQLRSREKIT